MSDRAQNYWWNTALHAISRRTSQLGPVLTVAFVALIVIGVGAAIAGARGQFSHDPHPSWVLLWRGAQGERYYIDAATIHSDSAGVHVVAFNLSPVDVGARSGLGASQVVQRQDATYRCDPHTVSLTTATTVETGIRSDASGEYQPVVVGGTTQDHGLREATWEYLCHPSRVAPARPGRSQ